VKSIFAYGTYGIVGRVIRRMRYAPQPVDISWVLERVAPYEQVYEHHADWIIADFILPCEVRIMKRFAEMGISWVVPQNLPELTVIPRRSRSIWG